MREYKDSTILMMEYLDNPIIIHRAFLSFLDANEALILSLIVNWSKQEEDRWAYQEESEWLDATGYLDVAIRKKAIKKLLKLQLIHTGVGSQSKKIYYQSNNELINICVLEAVKKRQKDNEDKEEQKND